MNKDIRVIIDCGHGNNCPGKCSPDNTFYEWQFTREIGKLVAALLKAQGITVYFTWVLDHEPLSMPGRTCVKAELDNALNYRWKQVNKICKDVGTKNCISVSIHANAAGADGKWHDARGFQVYVGKKASQQSKWLAKSIYAEAIDAWLQGNRSVPAEHYWVQGLAMCDRTSCPAVLVEALFQDNKEDVQILKSKEGKRLIADIITNGIVNYINSL